jgi:hypothetical protein
MILYPISWLLFKFVLWYTLFLFCVEFKIVLYQFLYRCGHFNLSLIANQTISDLFLEMCSPVKFAHSLSKKSRKYKTSSVQDYIYRTKLFPEHFMSIPIGTKMLTKPPNQNSKTHLKNHTFKKNCTKHF